MNSKTAARSILGKLSITLALLMISCLALGQSNKKPESAPAAPSASKRAPAAQRPAPPANRGPAQNSAQGRPNNASNTTHGPNAAHGAPVGSNGAGGANSARGMNNARGRSEEHTSELQSPYDLVCRLLLEKKNTQS